jgi:hypothetical protein
MWPARGGARARWVCQSRRILGHAPGTQVKVRTGRTSWATSSDLAPDTRFGGGLPEVLAHRCAGRRVNGEASARDEARRALHTVGRTSRQTPRHRAAGGHQRRAPSRATFERRFFGPLSRVRALGPAPPTIIPPNERRELVLLNYVICTCAHRKRQTQARRTQKRGGRQRRQSPRAQVKPQAHIPKHTNRPRTPPQNSKLKPEARKLS